MKLHTVFITHNRLELTKQAISSYLDTVSVPSSIWVVDNASTDGTREWLLQSSQPDHGLLMGYGYSLLDENRYPGYACNEGWRCAPEDATHYQRADNDFAFLRGWCEEIKNLFVNDSIGQVGLRTDSEEGNVQSNVGGNCVITKEIWDKGLRYDERPWTKYPPGYSEDSYFSPRVRGLGFRWTRVKKPCIESLASGDLNDPYYQKSYGDRRILCEHGKMRSNCGRSHED